MNKAAEILVECGYGESSLCKDLAHSHIRVKDESFGSATGYRGEAVQPFADTLEGRRQADAIEDWLDNTSKHFELWDKSAGWCKPTNGNHQWRLDRIKWCLEQLEAK